MPPSMPQLAPLSQVNLQATQSAWIFRKALPVLALGGVWWGCSAWNAVAAKRILHRGDGDDAGPLRVAVVSAGSNVFGIVALLVMRFLAQVQVCVGRPALMEMPAIDGGLAASHAIGLYAAYRGLLCAKVSAVQAVKALEPLIAMYMSATPFFAGSEHAKWPAVESVMAAMVTTIGVCIVCVDDTSFEVEALLWVLLSSLVTQGRNHFLKRRQRDSEGQKTDLPVDAAAPRVASDTIRKPGSAHAGNQSPAVRGCLVFIATSAGAFFVNLAMVFSELSFRPGADIYAAFGGAKTGPVLVAGATHFMYNLASFAVLSVVIPATHSLANTAKRAVIMFASAYFLNDLLTARTCLGVALVIVGSGHYGYIAKTKPKAAGVQSDSASPWWLCVGAQSALPKGHKSAFGLLLLLALSLPLVYWTVMTTQSSDDYRADPPNA